MSDTARLAIFGLRIIRAVVGWLFPLRLTALALALVLAANLVTTPAPSTASHPATTTTHTHRNSPPGGHAHHAPSTP